MSFSEILRKVAAAPAVRPPPGIGDVVAGYRLERILGEGGMGRVHLATEVSSGRRVALKTMHAVALGDAELRARFAREAESASAIHHPNVAEVLAAGESEAGPFLALEWVEGEPLRQALARGAFDEGPAVALAIEIAAGLAAIHRAGVVHRDIKPDNIVLTPGASAKIVDFGIAKLVGEAERRAEPAGPGAHTAPMMGTRRYLSPEQLSGGAIDARADVFAFGVVLHELLTGRLPESQWGGGHELPEGTSAELGRLIRSCLSLERGARPRDGDEVHRALLSIQAERARRGRLRRIGFFAAAVGLVVALGFGASLFLTGALVGLRARAKAAPTAAPPATASEAASGACMRRRACCDWVAGNAALPRSQRICQNAARRDALTSRAPSAPPSLDGMCDTELRVIQSELRKSPTPAPAACLAQSRE